MGYACCCNCEGIIFSVINGRDSQKLGIVEFDLLVLGKVVTLEIRRLISYINLHLLDVE